ncbi:MAG: YkvA family protein [Cyclobacteriaceae bacterium]|jgi:uncharacterized membrane protein YkvA (DUF1232 family)
MSEDKNKYFIRAFENAKRIFSNKKKVLETLDNAFKKSIDLENENGEISSLTEKVKLFILMIQSYVKGEYREIPFKSILLIFTGLIYFINPFDLIGDFIPGIGYIDDIGLILWILKSVEEDVVRFKENYIDIQSS